MFPLLNFDFEQIMLADTSHEKKNHLQLIKMNWPHKARPIVMYFVRIKRRLQHRYFLVNITKFLRTPTLNSEMCNDGAPFSVLLLIACVVC